MARKAEIEKLNDPNREFATNLKKTEVPYEHFAYKRSPIIWVASYPKSGNTWLRSFWTSYARGGNYVNLNGLDGSMDTNPYVHSQASPVPLETLTQDEIYMLRPAALLYLCYNDLLASTMPRLVKSHCAFSPLLHPEPLTLKVIHIVRDPRDVAISFSHFAGEPLNSTIEAMAEEGRVTYKKGWPIGSPMGSWSQHTETWLNNTLPKGRCLTIRYEDILANPVDEFRKVLQSLPVDLNENVLRKAVEACSFAHLSKREDDHGFGEMRGEGKFFVNGTSGHWKDVLTDKQVKAIERDHGEMMVRLGYLEADEKMAGNLAAGVS